MLEWIMQIAQLCNMALAAGKAMLQRQADKLSGQERELLAAASDDGLSHALQSDAHGRLVMSGGKPFTHADPAITAHYLDAFIRLCGRGLVMHQGNALFRLTGQGFDMARALRAEQQKDEADMIRKFTAN